MNVLVDMFWWICSGGYVLVDMFWWICSGGYVLVDMFWWICSGGCVAQSSIYDQYEIQNSERMCISILLIPFIAWTHGASLIALIPLTRATWMAGKAMNGWRMWI